MENKRTRAILLQDGSRKINSRFKFWKNKILHTIFGQITTWNFTSDNRQQEVSMYYHLVLQQIYVVNTVQKIHLISVSSLYQQITSLFCPVFSHDKSFYSFLWKSPNNEESNVIKRKNVTKKSYNVHALILKKSWVTNKISCFYWCVSNDRNQFWLSILYDETINMQNTFMFNCSLCAIHRSQIFCLIEFST